MKKNQKLEAIDLFCGIGGLSYGIKQSGITVIAGLDNDVSCRQAYENNVQAEFIHADITNYDFNDLKNRYSSEGIKILLGCAPCQPFSSHSHKNRNKKDDSRWSLIDYFKQAVEKINPDIISVENVRGFVKTDVFSKFLTDLKAMQYQISYEVVYCPDYGIPQNRHRLVLLGSKIGKIDLPATTHRKADYLTVADTIRELPPLKAGERNTSDHLHYCKNLSTTNIKRIQKSKPGGTWRDWDKSLLPNCYKKESGSTYSSVYGRMEWNRVSPTITTQFFNYGSGRFGHPDQERGLSLREGALLQTFPKDYDFGKLPTLEKIGKHVGNAVPPRLGEVIGKEIIRTTNESIRI